MRSIKAFFTDRLFSGGLLKSGNVAVHTTERRIFFGITDRDTVEIMHIKNCDDRYYVQSESGTWDDPLVLNGGGYLWYDGTNIRGKTGAAPTSETDGTIII